MGLGNYVYTMVFMYSSAYRSIYIISEPHAVHPVLAKVTTRDSDAALPQGQESEGLLNQ